MRTFLIIAMLSGLFLFGFSNETSAQSQPKSIIPTQKNFKGIFMPFNVRTGLPTHTGNLIVMFQKGVQARASRTLGTDLFSMRGADLNGAVALCLQYEAKIRQNIDMDPREIENLISLAQRKSQKPMPDVAGMMCVVGIPHHLLVAAANDFLQLDEVEWVHIQGKTEIANGPPVPTTSNFCEQCGAPVGNPPCNAEGCNYPHPRTQAPFVPSTPPDPPVIPAQVGFCNPAGTAVCTQVVAIRPGCAFTWDESCASTALARGPTQYGSIGGGTNPTAVFDTCFNSPAPGGTTGSGGNWPDWNPTNSSVLLETSPFIVHSLGGSAIAECCSIICDIDPFCCNTRWDASCVSIAFGQTTCYQTMNFLPTVPNPTPSEGGNPFVPSPQAISPLFDAKMLGVNADMPLITLADLPLGGSAAAGSAPLALWGVKDRDANPPAPAGGAPAPPLINNPFITFENVTQFRAGGLDLAKMKAVLQSVPGDGLATLRGIKVALVEPSALVQHEDLCPGGHGTPSKIHVEANQTPYVTNALENNSNEFAKDTEHGTADLGILFGIDNNIGVTGIANTVDPYFYATQTFEQGNRFVTALTTAVRDLGTPTASDPNPGNVIVMPITIGGVPLNADPEIAAIITLGEALGVTIVIAAGNDSVAIPAGLPGTESTIVVGGVNPGYPKEAENQTVPPFAPNILGDKTMYPAQPYSRSSTSNFSIAPDTGRVTVSAWGIGVCSLGYGDLFCGANSAATTTNSEYNLYTTNRQRTYTAIYGGSSAATAQIGGLVAWMQALGKQLYGGQPFSPQNIHDLLADPNNVTPQSGQLLPTTFADARFGNTLYAGVGTNGFVGGFPRVAQIAASEISGSFYENNQTTYTIQCGTLLSGPPLSITEIDNKYVKARTARPQSNSASSAIGPAVFYPSSNRILDLQVIRTATVLDANDLERVSVRVTGRTVSVGSALVLVFIYNKVQNLWNIMPPYIGLMNGANLSLPQFTLPCGYNAEDFAIPLQSGGVNLATRTIIIPVGGLGQAQIWVDQVLILYNDPLIEVTDCGGGG